MPENNNNNGKSSYEWQRRRTLLFLIVRSVHVYIVYSTPPWKPQVAILDVDGTYNCSVISLALTVPNGWCHFYNLNVGSITLEACTEK